MIVKKTFNPVIVAGHIWPEAVLSLLTSVFVFLRFREGGYPQVAFASAALGPVSTALSIFLGFKSNAAYGRWWEARTQWSAITAAARILARLVVTFADADAKMAAPTFSAERTDAWKKRMVYRLVAWVLAVRNTLRFGPGAALNEVEPFLLDKDELATLKTKGNAVSYLLELVGRDIYRAMGNGTLSGFDSFQMEGQIAALTAAYSACERIKNTPVPRAYHVFSRTFVLVFIVLLPFCTISGYALTLNDYMVIPVSLLISVAFAIVDKTAVLLEDPFANSTNDVPMSALAIDIERDVRELLDEAGELIPALAVPVDGCLY